jgi:glutaredoxin-related protein
MQIKMFWQDNCPNCGPAKDMVKQFKDKIDINYLNINDIE